MTIPQMIPTTKIGGGGKYNFFMGVFVESTFEQTMVYEKVIYFNAPGDALLFFKIANNL